MINKIKYEIIPRGTILYRSALTVENKPKPRHCNDTDKVGVYFAAFNPYLSETMILEYKQPSMPIAIYITTNDIKVCVGKYAHLMNGKHLNISHIDYEVIATDVNVEPCTDMTAELFLVKTDLSNIKYIGYYVMTLDECKRKYYSKYIPHDYFNSISSAEIKTSIDLLNNIGANIEYCAYDNVNMKNISNYLRCHNFHNYCNRQFSIDDIVRFINMSRPDIDVIRKIIK